MKKDRETILFGILVVVIVLLGFMQADIKEKQYKLHNTVEIENFKNQQY